MTGTPANGFLDLNASVLCSPDGTSTCTKETLLMPFSA
jgi:hypothetical protein